MQEKLAELNKCAKDMVFRARLLAAFAESNVDGIIALAAEKGIELTADEVAGLKAEAGIIVEA